MAIRESKNLSLTPENAAFVAACVESGRYQSASEVVSAALRLLADQEAERLNVRRQVQEGVDQLDRGDTVDGESVFRRLAQKHEKLRGAKPQR